MANDNWLKLTGDRLGQPSPTVRAEVEAATNMQQTRFEGKVLT